jgi:hypothetical protein
MVLGSTQPLTEMSTRKLPGGKKRPARRADNLAAIYEPNVRKRGSLNLSQSYGPPQLVQGQKKMYYAAGKIYNLNFGILIVNKIYGRNIRSIWEPGGLKKN